MTRTIAITTLAVAALLEAGGDALIRVGLTTDAVHSRGALFSIAAIVLFLYGWTVNAPPWDFGKLLGLYVVFFFVFAQLISWLVFRQQASLSVWIGGVLIVCGGIVIAVAQA